MLYTIKNNSVTVVISDVGGELWSVKKGDCEYIWNGNQEFWSNRAPLVFPICGRLFEAKYQTKGKVYDIPIHGFIRPSTLSVVEHNEDSICFELKTSEETLKVYPYDFIFKVWYILEGDKLINRFEISNPSSSRILPATVGGHPGFNVPLDGNGTFEDYYIEFDNECSPDRFLFSERCLLTGRLEAFELETGRILRLRHDLFDDDAIFLCRMDSAVTLKSKTTDRFVKLEYADMPYLGIWHKPQMAAPYVCIEPWCGMPGHDSVMEDMEKRPYMFHIQPESKKTVEFSMLFG